VSEQQVYLTQQRLRSPRSAAIAGLIFSVLLGVIIIVIQISFPADPVDFSGDWLEDNSNAVSLAIGLVPVAGLAFLWFMGVARDLLGHLEDQFFSTVFTGSGLLFLGMLFIWASIGGTILIIHNENPEILIEGGFYKVGRILMSEVIGVFAMSMAGAYVFSTGSIWLRTGVVPRWLAILTWGIAVVLWLSLFLSWWIRLAFPIWVFVVSVYILAASKPDLSSS
jgi:hypothetical protein